MSSQPAAAPAAEPVPFRPYCPAEHGRPYPLDLLKAYGELRERERPPDERPDSATPAEVKQDAEPPPRVTADSSGSPPKHGAAKDDTKPTSCDSTDQLSERCSPPAAAKLTGPDGPPGAAQDPGIRRYRTAFRPDQIKRLESEFLKDNYVSRPKRNELATELGLAEGTIKVWFQNRRMKHKRQQMTAWPLDPRFADPALAAMILQAAVASGTYPYGGAAGLAAPPLPYYSPLAAGAKCRLSPYAPLPVRPQPSLAPAGFLLPPLDGCRLAPPAGLHSPLLSAPPPSAVSSSSGSLSPTVSAEQTGFFRPFKPDSPVTEPQ